MLENIKLILNITDDSQDNLILLYLAKVETMVVDYCNVNELTGGIKSISRGDTKIEYNVGEAVVSTSNGATLTSSDKEFLKQYRRARCY